MKFETTRNPLISKGSTLVLAAMNEGYVGKLEDHRFVVVEYRKETKETGGYMLILFEDGQSRSWDFVRENVGPLVTFEGYAKELVRGRPRFVMEGGEYEESKEEPGVGVSIDELLNEEKRKRARQMEGMKG